MKHIWQKKCIGDVCEVVNGGTPRTNVPEYWGGEHRWITPAEMGKRESPYVHDTERRLTDAGLRNSSARMLPPFSVVLSSRAPIGHLIINTEPMSTNQGCKSLIPSNQLEYKFLYYYLSSIVELLESLGTGATFKELSGGKLKEVPIPLPHLTEQQRIVKILDEAFAGLANASANAEKNLKNARALFESHLNEVFTKRGEGWVETTIGSENRFIDYRGKTPVKTSSGIRLITAKNVKMGYVQESPMEFIAADNYQSWMTRGIPKKGDILFTTEAPLANVAQLDTDGKVAFAQRIIIMQPNAEKLDCTFLKYLLLSQPVQERIRTKGTGATVQGIKASLLKTIEISFPKILADQKQIVAKLDALSEETQHLARIYTRKIFALAALKQSLLHQAFNGEL
ncbi:MAG: restriction endonuclease subunit S [Ignavibacteriae bacterium]|nr:restriction endonuclease subunit S [Ignavibacteriota bacterium]